MGSIWQLIFGRGEKKANAPTRVDLPSDLIPLKLAGGRGFGQDVVGESFRQDALGLIAGGKSQKSASLKVVAQLVFDEANPNDPNAVGILIDRYHVGFIPRVDAPAFREEILAINPSELPVVCHGKIVGRWDHGHGDSGHFGVKLSLARPLRITAGS